MPPLDSRLDSLLDSTPQLRPTAETPRLFAPRGPRPSGVAGGLYDLAQTLGPAVHGPLSVLAQKHDKEALKEVVRQVRMDDARNAAEILRDNPELAGYSRYVEQLAGERDGHRLGRIVMEKGELELEQKQITEPVAVQAYLEDLKQKTIEANGLGLSESKYVLDGFVESFIPAAESMVGKSAERHAKVVADHAIDGLGESILGELNTYGRNNNWNGFVAQVEAHKAANQFVGISEDQTEEVILDTLVGWASLPENFNSAPAGLRASLVLVDDPKVRRALQAQVAAALSRKLTWASTVARAEKDARDKRLTTLFHGAAPYLVRLRTDPNAPLPKGQDATEYLQSVRDRAMEIDGEKGLDRFNDLITDTRSASASTTVSPQELQHLRVRAMYGDLDPITIVRMHLDDTVAEELIKVASFDRTILREVPVVDARDALKQSLSRLLTQEDVKDAAEDIPGGPQTLVSDALMRFDRAMLMLGSAGPEVRANPETLGETSHKVVQRIEKFVSDSITAKTGTRALGLDINATQQEKDRQRQDIQQVNEALFEAALQNILNGHRRDARLLRETIGRELGGHIFFEGQGYHPDPVLLDYWQE